jgi:ribonuclease HI
MEKGDFFGGQVPVACSSSNDGEFWGLALALSEVRSRIGNGKPDAIVLQCDNLAALAWVGRFHPKARGVGERHGTHAIPDAPPAYPDNMEVAVETVRSTFADVTIWLKHVKGHDGRSKTARSWVNRQCDREAREHMVARRAFMRRALRRA